jgi:hypothetical protein
MMYLIGVLYFFPNSVGVLYGCRYVDTVGLSLTSVSMLNGMMDEGASGCKKNAYCMFLIIDLYEDGCSRHYIILFILSESRTAGSF